MAKSSLFDFLRRSKKKGTGQSRAADSSQKKLSGFYSNSQEKKFPLIQTVSVNSFEREVNAKLKSFKSFVALVKESSLRMEELRKLLKSGEINESSYKIIMDELESQLSLSVEEAFRSREVLELDKAKAKLERAKEKIGFEEFDVQRSSSILDTHWRDSSLARQQSTEYHASSKWEMIVSKIDTALSALSIEDEASIIEQYLSSIKENLSQPARESGALQVCRQRHHLISEEWSSIRRDKIEQIINLELEVAQLKDEIKELDARFAVGELNQSIYESRTGAAQGSLRSIERKIVEIRTYIDNIDMKMFRCSELMRQNP